MKWTSLLVLVCALLGVALVTAEADTQHLTVSAVDLAGDEVAESDAVEVDAEADDEAEDEAENEVDADAEEEDAAEAEDEVFLQETAAVAAAGAAKAQATAAVKAEADTELSDAFDRMVQHQIAQSDAAEQAAAEEDAHLKAAAAAAVESTLAAAHINAPSVLSEAADADADVDADESSLVEANAAAEVVLDVDADLGAELETAANNEQLMDQWLDAEFEAEAGADAEAAAEGPLDGEDPVDALIKDAPALPRDQVKIVAPKKKSVAAKKLAKKQAKKARAARRAAIAAGKTPKPLKKQGAVPFVDPRVVRKWKNIKETTIAYLRAVRKHIKSKYGKNAVALVAAGVKATREVYTICLKYGRNKFLCAVLRDLFLKNYVRADVDLFSKKTGRRFVRENMKRIIKFTHHHVRHPYEFTGEYMNQKFLKDPYTTCPKRMGREIRKFLRALRYAVTEKHPDLTHELVDDFNSVFATATKRCAKLQAAVEFNHPLCDVLLKVLNKKFATKDVFLDRKVRAQFVRAVKAKVKRARKAERKAKGLPAIDPVCNPKAAAKAEKALKKALKKKEAAEKLAAKAAALAAPEPQPTPATPAPAAAATAAPAEAPRRRRGGNGNGKGKGKGKGKGRGGRGGSSGSGRGGRKSLSSSGRSNLVYSRINAAVTKDRYEITIRLNLNYQTVAATPEDLEAFIKTFAADTARALNLATERVSVTAVQAADAGATGINVKFLILPDASAPNGSSDPKAANSVDAAADKFAAQTQDSKSTLMTSPILSKLATDSQVALVKQQSTSKSAASAQAVVSAALVALLSLVAVVAAARV